MRRRTWNFYSRVRCLAPDMEVVKPLEARPRYSLTWAASIVCNFIGTCPRGWNFLATLAQIDTNLLVKVLARNQGEWHILRRLVSRIEAYHAMAEVYGYNIEWIENNARELLASNARLVAQFEWQTLARWLRGLSGKLGAPIIEEPVLKVAKPPEEEVVQLELF